MEVGNRGAETDSIENLECDKIPASVMDQGLENIILEYAISTFPYTEAFEYVPGLDDQQLPELIHDLISNGVIKIGFYYEEMQDHLTIFYFLRVTDEKHIVLGLNPNNICVRISDIEGIFRLDDEQYLDLLQIPLC